MTGPHGEAWRDFEARALEGLAPPLDDLLLHLLHYKRIFVGPSFARLGGDAARGALEAIREDTQRQAIGTVDALHQWNRLRPRLARASDVTEWTRRRILDDLLTVKESSTEIFLNAALNAPTDELRQRLIRLADEDSGHAEVLRRIVGGRATTDLRRSASAGGDVGAAAGRRDGSLRAGVEADLAHLRGRGVEPTRIALSDAAVRRLRDENAVDMARGLAFGLPVDVEFGWSGQCYAIATRERITLAELVTGGRQQDA